jgi:hypothetical protein
MIRLSAAVFPLFSSTQVWQMLCIAASSKNPVLFQHRNQHRNSFSLAATPIQDHQTMSPVMTVSANPIKVPATAINGTQVWGYGDVSCHRCQHR